MNPDLLSRTRTDLLLEYNMCFERWLSMNAQVWQVPALAMTAQAFLFTTMFSSATASFPRLAAACLAVLVSFLSIHLMRKHRHHQTLDYGRMTELEEELGLTRFAQSGWRDETGWEHRTAKKLTGGRTLQLRKEGRSSVDVWVAGFCLFAAVAVGVGITAFALPDIYEVPPPPATVEQK